MLSTFLQDYRFFVDGCIVGIIGLIIRKIWITAVAALRNGKTSPPAVESTHEQLKHELVENTLMHPIEPFYTLESTDPYPQQNVTVNTNTGVKLILTVVESGKKLYFNSTNHISIGGKEDECSVFLDDVPQEIIAEIYHNPADGMFYLRRVSSDKIKILLNANPLTTELKIKNKSVIRLGNHDISVVMRATE